MKITSNIGTLPFKAQEQVVVQNPNEKTKAKKKKYVDPLTNWPLRGLGYTNDVGITINELAPATARLFWVPALMYFGADIYDKYKNKGDKYKPNGERAFSQAVFQALASIAFPAVFGHIGMTAFSYGDKFRGEKLSTNAKEQSLRFIKNHSALHEVLDEGKDKKEVLEQFTDNFNKFYKAKKKSFKRQNFLVKTYDTLLGNCKRGAVAHADEERIKAYAKKQFTELLETCNDTEVAKHVIDKKIFRLKAWKSAGAFTAIILTAKAVDTFVEKIIIKKFVRPQVQKLKEQKFNIKDFSNSQAAEKPAQETKTK